MVIAIQPDVTIILGRKQFPSPVSHIVNDMDIQIAVTDEGLALMPYITTRRLLIFSGKELRATCSRFKIKTQERIIRLYKNATTLHPLAP